jgi:transketolase
MEAGGGNFPTTHIPTSNADSSTISTTRKTWLTELLSSNGHGCMLQYALLHLFGYALSMDDIKAFRVSLIGKL